MYEIMSLVKKIIDLRLTAGKIVEPIAIARQIVEIYPNADFLELVSMIKDQVSASEFNIYTTR